jgi:excinuclease ABC subunit C
MDNLKDKKEIKNKKEIRFKNTLDILPKKPGVYVFKDTKGRIIYIGKAKSIYDRVRSYFQANDSINFTYHPITFFLSRIHSIDFIVTDNEIEALILESNLIKKNKPKYNISLKDDKSYPYIAITDSDKFPRVFMTRNRNIKDARYFGPYINVKSVKEILEHLRRIFQVRDCKKGKPGKVKNSACLNYHINLCSAPCVGHISEELYRRNINYIKMFLKGSDRTIADDLKKEMMMYAGSEEFEEAARIKEKIDAINKLHTNQKIFFSGEDAWDILALSKSDDADMAVVSLYDYREGELAIINNFIISNSKYLNNDETMSGFIKKYYEDINNMPSKIFIPFEIDDAGAIENWLSDIKNKKVEIRIPKIGEKKKIMDMAARNAKLYLEKKKFEKDTNYSKFYKDLIKLKEILDLNNIPRRIECFDISNLQASFAVGSMVVFIDGNPLNSNYRHFRIKNVQGQDDYAMIEEVVERRVKYLEDRKVSIENSFYIKPDLIIIDGGKAQFNAAYVVLFKNQLLDIDLISIAKKEEIVFCKKYINGIRLDRNSNYMRIITRIRDEAHRFAVGYHKNLRGKYLIHSIFDEIPGIGERKKEYISNKFNTIEDLKFAKLEDLLNIKGLSYRDALNIYNYLHK